MGRYRSRVCTLPDDTKPLIHACVASVIHNSDFLSRNLSQSHPYHGCPLAQSSVKMGAFTTTVRARGRSAFKSLLEQTGQSLISRLCVDLSALRHMQQTGTASNQAMIDEMHELRSRSCHTYHGAPTRPTCTKCINATRCRSSNWLPACIVSFSGRTHC